MKSSAQIAQQIFRQMKPKAQGILYVFASILAKYDGKDASKMCAEPIGVILSACTKTQWSSYKGRKENALAPGADEGRSNLRKASGSRKQTSIRGFPNGETHLSGAQVSYGESNSRMKGTA